LTRSVVFCSADWTAGPHLSYNLGSHQSQFTFQKYKPFIMFINNIFFKLRELVVASPAKRDRIILSCLVTAAIFNLVSWLAVIIAFWHTNDFIVLQYNIYFGISSLGPWAVLLELCGFGLVVGLVNFVLSFWLYLKEKLFSYFLAGTAVAVNAIILAALCFIIYMNF